MPMSAKNRIPPGGAVVPRNPAKLTCLSPAKSDIPILKPVAIRDDGLGQENKKRPVEGRLEENFGISAARPPLWDSADHGEEML